MSGVRGTKTSVCLPSVHLARFYLASIYLASISRAAGMHMHMPTPALTSLPTEHSAPQAAPCFAGFVE